MELHEFVSSTLIDIIKGVKMANEAVEYNRPFALSNKHSSEDERFIAFDVAVVTSNKTDAQAKGGLKVYVASLGSDMSVEQRNEKISRSQFKILVNSIIK